MPCPVRRNSQPLVSQDSKNTTTPTDRIELGYFARSALLSVELSCVIKTYFPVLRCPRHRHHSQLCNPHGHPLTGDSVRQLALPTRTALSSPISPHYRRSDRRPHPAARAGLATKSIAFLEPGCRRPHRSDALADDQTQEFPTERISWLARSASE